jgi:hypothetical protein
MSLDHEIEIAFNNREMPSVVVRTDGRTDPDDFSSDERDALWFLGKDRAGLSWEDWSKHAGSIFQFTPEAFAYYLPSLLTVSSAAPDKWLMPADGLVSVLANEAHSVDRGSLEKNSRIRDLKSGEYQALRKWLELMAKYDTYNGVGAMDEIKDALTTVASLCGEARS